jgi:multidrug efflux pump subunit AcrB
MQSLFRFFAERHLLAYIITILILLLGLSTLLDIKRDVYPAVDFGMVRIMTRYPGASPEDVELNVTNKIEKEVQTVTGIAGVTSVSMENISLIYVSIDIDAHDIDKTKNEVREAVGRVSDLPPEVTESPYIWEMTHQSANSIIEVNVSGDLSYQEMRDYAHLIEKKLNNISGVAKLERVGYHAREIRVEVLPEKINKYQIPIREIISAIQSRNIRGTTGSFESYTSEKDLVTLAQFEDPLEVGDVIVRSTFDGPVIKVKDLAIIKDDFADVRLLSRVNGNAAISFRVFKTEAADVIRTCDAIKELINNENETAPAGIEIMYSNDSSYYIANSFDVVLNNGWMGLVLVIILLPIFLNFRTALWVAMGIPVTFLGTIFLLPLFGGYLDTITLSGMILVIGIIVDDAIIIADNISMKREKGDSPIDAAVNGLQEVFKPVITTVLTTFLVFAPMFFMPGVFGKYLIPIPLALSIALLVSLVESVLVLPAHLTTGMKKRSVKATGRTWFRNISHWYQGIMPGILRFRYLLILVFVLYLFGTFWYAGSNMKMIMFPSGMAEEFFLTIELPVGTPLKATSERVTEIEALVAQLPAEELASYNTWIGTNINVGAESENFAAMSVLLTPYTDRDRSAEEIVNELRLKTDDLQGFIQIAYSITSGGPPVGKPISLRIVGSADKMRTELTDSVEAFLATIPGVKDISRDDISGKDQVKIDVDYDRLARLGLTVADVATNVRLAFDGEVVTGVRYMEMKTWPSG